MSAISELEPFPPLSRCTQGILGIVLKRNIDMVRSKAQVAGQHPTIFSAPGMHERKSPKAHYAEAIAPPALEMGTTFPSLLCIPDSLDQTMGQSVKFRTEQHPGGSRQGSPRDGLKHGDKKPTLACSAFAIPSEPRVVCCRQCLQGAAAGPAAWVGHYSPHCISPCPVPV